MSLFEAIRDAAMLSVTFWKKTAKRKGIILSLRGASPRVRFALMTDYEYEDARLCSAILDKADSVLELGSAIGFLSLYCKRNIGIENFAMVEANPFLLEIIEENYRLNGYGLPKIHNIAVGPHDGTATFNISRDYYSSSLTNKDKGSLEINVDQSSIPSIINSLHFTPNVLIMDIEGGEVDIPIDHLCLFDKIIVELHDRFVGNEKISRLVGELVANGFRQAGTDGYSKAFLKA